MANFKDQVYAAVRKIPEGKIATCGDIAKIIGKPQAARAAGSVLAAPKNKKSASNGVKITPDYKVTGLVR